MIEEWFRWLGHTQFSADLRNSTWGFAVTETVHLLGLALLGGAALAVNLSAGQALFRSSNTAAVARASFPPLVIGLAMMVASGILLVVSKPLRYYFDITFRAKMVLLILAIGSSWIVHCLATRDRHSSAALRSTAFLSLSLWLGVGACGRLIGFL